jgi:hypothetical protein
MFPQFLSRHWASHTDSGECRGFSFSAREFWAQNVLLAWLLMYRLKWNHAKFVKTIFWNMQNFLWKNHLVGYKISAHLVASKRKQFSERELKETANLWCFHCIGKAASCLLVAVIIDACLLFWLRLLQYSPNKQPSHPSHWKPKFWRTIFDTSKVNEFFFSSVSKMVLPEIIL